MRFCPKCSLKIKANIEQCPICKVELLSCADDEEQALHVPQGEQSSQVVSNQESMVLPETNVPLMGGESKSDLIHSIDIPPSHVANDYDGLFQKVTELESHLKTIKSTLTLSISKNDVIKKSIVDLESKLSKVEKTIVQLETFPFDRLETIEKEIAHLQPHTNAPSSSEMQSPELRPSPRGYSQTRMAFTGRMSSQDFSSEDSTLSEEEVNFTKDDSDDFSPAFHPSDSPLDDDMPHQVQKTHKKKIPLFIPVLALLLIAAWLGFYYAKPRQQQIQTQKAIVAEPSTPPPPLQNTESFLKETLQPSVKNKAETTGINKAPQPSPETTEKRSTLSQDALPALKDPSDKSTAYTVNVGSFKDKNLALALTSQLNEKGYPAGMSLSKHNNFYRVKVGSFSTVEEARAYAADVEQKEKLPTFVTSLSQP